VRRFRPLPPLELVQAQFTYDPDEGILKPLVPRKNWSDSPKSGYQTARLMGHRYNIARICWYLQTGQDPGELEVDHRDRDPFNNRFSNLRLSTRAQQLANRRRTSHTDLPKGVSFIAARNSYSVAWGASGTKRTVGGFDSVEEAHLFYLWNTRHHGVFADPLPISACPPLPRDKHRNRRRANTPDTGLPKGVSYVRRRRSDGSTYIAGFQACFVNQDGKAVSKKFKTAKEASDYYLSHRKCDAILFLAQPASAPSCLPSPPSR